VNTIAPEPKLMSRRWLMARSTTAVAALIAAPSIVRAQGRLTLSFKTIPDPDGWHPSLRLKGDWLIFAISDGVNTGYGEASQSRDDESCRETAARIFADRFNGFAPTLSALAGIEAEFPTMQPDLVTATAWSGILQALYDLLARREQVPVWQLFRDRPAITRLPLYTTINRALQDRTTDEYLDIVATLDRQGFTHFKCAPFEAVDGPDGAVAKAEAGLTLLQQLRDAFPDLGMRVDFHERFELESFLEILPRLERLRLEWIEEPFTMGPDFAVLTRATRLPVAAGELFWGWRGFAPIVDNGWADVIMPDVKHVGGFGILVDVMRRAEGRVEVSPHNPAGPIATAASLHAAAVRSGSVRALEYAFDRLGSRHATGEIVESGSIHLSDRPGWGVEPPQ